MSYENFSAPSLNAPSREQFSAPDLESPASAASQNSNVSSFTDGNTRARGFGFESDVSQPVEYSCGDCDAKVIMKRGDPIRCKECGYRVIYKERTTKMVQFEAR